MFSPGCFGGRGLYDNLASKMWVKDIRPSPRAKVWCFFLDAKHHILLFPDPERTVGAVRVALCPLALATPNVAPRACAMPSPPAAIARRDTQVAGMAGYLRSYEKPTNPGRLKDQNLVVGMLTPILP